jgi:hypothetical protein
MSGGGTLMDFPDPLGEGAVLIAGEFWPVGRLMDRLEARARIHFGSLWRRLARLLGW